MKLQQIVKTPYLASRIAYGCMGIGGSWDHNSLNINEQRNATIAIETAFETGINIFDHADIYCFGKSEHAFAQFIIDKPHLRDKIILQSKCGIRIATDNHIGHYDFSYDHIINSVEQSLKRLQTSYLDILLLHRPDVLVEGEEVAKAFSELHQSGKVRFFGVSNHTVMQIMYLQKYIQQPLVINQVQLNVIDNDLFNSGIVGGGGNSLDSVGLVEYCRINDITIQAWGPLASGKIFVEQPQNHRVAAVQKVLHKLAEKYCTNTMAIALAWILLHPAQIQPVIGSSNPSRIRNACEAINVDLTRSEWYELFVAGRGANLP
ncbi:aldo/keto reductase family oxidoreductase [Candidatus Uabimicrobium sp. HlEnr_7]|uniref:aldo/keto reductase n=1 Tax=Candidatus Uabimicrobium helgolandensis TaxID=3095367 RepID=UPI003556C268